MVKEVLGDNWLTNKWFRFGASSLANDLLMQILKTETGVYQSADYFLQLIKMAKKTNKKHLGIGSST